MHLGLAGLLPYMHMYIQENAIAGEGLLVLEQLAAQIQQSLDFNVLPLIIVLGRKQAYLMCAVCCIMCREVMQVLPDPSSFSSVDLPVLTKLHLSSAHNLMATLKLLAPAAFAAGSSQPDLNALDEADSSLLGMAATLIELQLFHLQRAAALTATTRKRLTQHGDGVHMGSWSVSRDSSSDASSNSQQMC
jgi:hypothetical protein